MKIFKRLFLVLIVFISIIILNPAEVNAAWEKGENNKWYYRDESGNIVEGGWRVIEGNYYFFNHKGWMYTGWYGDSRESNWYYMNENGIMLTGWQNINSSWYYFNSNGLMQHDVVIDGYTLASNGMWIN